MRTGIHFTVTSGDRQRLQAIVADPKSSQKHVWRARIILKSDEGLGNSSIMAETGKSKTCVWRWQERFMHGGCQRLASRQVPSAWQSADPAGARRRDRPPDPASAAARGDPLDAAARWRRLLASRRRRSKRSGRPMASARTAGGTSSSLMIPPSPRSSQISSGLYVDPPAHAVVLSG